MTRSSIQSDILVGDRANPTELLVQDVGRRLSADFGQVIPSDVGRLIWNRPNGSTLGMIVMESMQQAQRRKRS